MENLNIYEDIAKRTQGDIYIGVVGPVRTGKSTFIKTFMDKMVIPRIENSFKKERAKDELPQSGSGKSIHTTEPKFIPNEAIEINFNENLKFKVRLVDCVGYIVDEALGHLEGDSPKMVKTPWFEEEIPFEEAAEIGTRKVITDHSTVGVVITTDGSFTGIDRESYVDAEERVILDLKSINKPFVVVLNTKHPNTIETQELKESLEEKYDVPVVAIDIAKMDENDIEKLFKRVLMEFPIKEIHIDLPSWINGLDSSHWLKNNFITLIKDMSQDINKISDIRKISDYMIERDEFLSGIDIVETSLGNGKSKLKFNIHNNIFYKILSEICNQEIDDEGQLLDLIKDLYKAKVEYDKVERALSDVRETGYGLVAPQLSEMKFEEPEIIRQGTRYGVKLKASAPSLHLIKADIQTEISPIMGTEKETEELVKSLLEQFENDPSSMWQSNMFGKSLEVLVKEGLQNKLYKMPEDVQAKIQKTLQKIVNEGSGGLICIIL